MDQKKDAQKLRIQAPEIKEGELFSRRDNALLSARGKPGRESVRLLRGLTDYEFNACFTGEWSGDSVLNRVQRNILTLSDEAGPRPPGFARTGLFRSRPAPASIGRWRPCTTASCSTSRRMNGSC